MKRSSWSLLVLLGLIAVVASGGCYPGAGLVGYIVPFYGWWGWPFGTFFCYLPYILVAVVVVVGLISLVAATSGGLVLVSALLLGFSAITALITTKKYAHHDEGHHEIEHHGGHNGWGHGPHQGWKLKVKWTGRRKRSINEKEKEHNSNFPYSFNEFLSYETQFGCGLKFICELAEKSTGSTEQKSNDGSLIYEIFGPDGYVPTFMAKSNKKDAIFGGDARNMSPSCSTSYPTCSYSMNDIWKIFK